MIKIDWDKAFYGVDGKRYSRDDIEEWYAEKTESIIRENLKKLIDEYSQKDSGIDPTPGLHKELLSRIKDNLHSLLTARPENLLSIFYQTLEPGLAIDTHVPIYNFDYFDLRRKRTILTSTEFIDDLLDAFDYKSFRSTLLPTLSEKLNIKSCPYCNQHFTLNITKRIITPATADEESDRVRYDTLAKFQFDHFYDKSGYPFLSMSLYNLIPSCAVCNHLKGTKTFSLIFHPYYNGNTSSEDETDNDKSGNDKELIDFRFRINQPLPALTGSRLVNDDNLLITLSSTAPRYNDLLKKFKEVLKLEERYSRHLDIVEEIFARDYLLTYYHNRENFINLLGQSANGTEHKYNIRKELYNRIIQGNYTDKEDYFRRPLAKFMGDLSQKN